MSVLVGYDVVYTSSTLTSQDGVGGIRSRKNSKSDKKLEKSLSERLELVQEQLQLLTNEIASIKSDFDERLTQVEKKTEQNAKNIEECISCREKHMF